MEAKSPLLAFQLIILGYTVGFLGYNSISYHLPLAVVPVAPGSQCYAGVWGMPWDD